MEINELLKTSTGFPRMDSDNVSSGSRIDPPPPPPQKKITGSGTAGCFLTSLPK